jgi:hypothetical protein
MDEHGSCFLASGLVPQKKAEVSKEKKEEEEATHTHTHTQVLELTFDVTSLRPEFVGPPGDSGVGLLCQCDEGGGAGGGGAKEGAKSVGGSGERNQIDNLGGGQGNGSGGGGGGEGRGDGGWWGKGFGKGDQAKNGKGVVDIDAFLSRYDVQGMCVCVCVCV